MGLANTASGFYNASEFQTSGLPWCTSNQLTGSTVTRYDFPFVSKFVSVINYAGAGNDLKLAFTRNGLDTNYVVLPGTTDPTWTTFDIRVTSVYLQASSGTVKYSLMGGLTLIQSRMMPLLSGTLPDETPGWQGVG